MRNKNIDPQFILNQYATIAYCTSYLIKINKSVTQEMQIILYKCKREQIETFEWFKKLGNRFLNAQQMSI